MPARVIALTTSKGGVGKSTLARNLAAHWLNIGMKVMLIDADPQGSIVNSHNPEGLLKDVTVIAEPEENVFNLVAEHRNQYNYIIIDTGGFSNRTTIKALLAADLALIPLKPSADDMAGAMATHNLIQELNTTPERVNNHIHYRMVITMSQQNTVIAKHVRSELEQVGYLILKSEMYHRVSYPEAAIDGLSPCILDPDGPAARDIRLIVQELNKII